MRNCLVLGAGRSGTSMITGALAEAGYFFGGAQHPARAANPKGFFETAEVNGINEGLLASMLPSESALGDGQRWLGVPRATARASADANAASLMRRAIEVKPFCLKDPRFSFTLPAWRPQLPDDTGLVCAFRHPALTATSLVQECETAAYLKGVHFDLERAFELWITTYRTILDVHSETGEWLFLHYDQMLVPEGRARLADFLSAHIDDEFADPKLRREVPDIEVPAEALELYEELCRRAEHETPAAREAADELTPLVAVLAWIAPGDEPHVPNLIADVQDQRGVRAELFLLDATDGELEFDGASAVPAGWSRGASYRSALAQTDAQYFAIAIPGARTLPAHLAHGVEALADADLATTDYVLSDANGQFIDRVSPAASGDVPGAYFEAGLVLRRAALEALAPTAFFPVELQLYRRLRAAGRLSHVVEPGFSVNREDFIRRWDRSQEDARLVTLADAPFEGPHPRLTVSLCTYNRRETLRECLEGFSRQLVPPGTFEIALTDDGSTDGTAERLDGLEYAVPVKHVSQENGGLSAARNAGLALAEGELVLFVNDDTIAFPNLVERHLARHAALAPCELAAVLGSFEQPPEALGNALLRYLEGSTEVFGYAEMDTETKYDGFRFWTCNVSVSLASVRAAGGYDESFKHYGCEDTDLGFRLGDLGYHVVFDPSARAYHRHFMDFDYVSRRGRMVARAYGRLVRKHPRLLALWGNDKLTAAKCERELARHAVIQSEFEDVARELSRMDIGALEELEGPYKELAEEVLTRLRETLPEVNRHWWKAGYREGMEEHGLTGFDELLADGLDPWPIAKEAPRVLLAWPRWDDPASLDELFERVRPITEHQGFAAVMLRRDPETDPPQSEALTALEAAYGRCYGDGVDLEVLLEEATLGRAQVLRLGRSVDGVLPLGGEPEGFLECIGAEPFTSAAAVSSWRARFEDPATGGGALPPASSESIAPETVDPEPRVPDISVIIPTHNRPKEFLQLLEALGSQDLSPARFEVLIVDDGSSTEVRPLVDRRPYPFHTEVLRQEANGPGSARDRGVARARGELIVFFNDDAVPAPDNLSRHLAAHGTTNEPIAVLGTFGLQRRHIRDSFAVCVERTSALFAQPLMKPGVRYHGLAFCTGNVSLPRASYEAVGGFDAKLTFAGGEDSEFGHRLERELGLRVVCDPRVRAEHDHALDIAGFARRRRVIGWSAHHIQAIHPDVELFEVQSFEELAFEVAANEEEATELVKRGTAICTSEREGTAAPGVGNEIPALIERLSEIEFRRGLLMAHQGRQPLDDLPSRSRPTPKPRVVFPSAGPGSAASSPAL